MSRKSGLGKGLSALIPTEYADNAPESGGTATEELTPAGRPMEVPIASVVPNHRQPRQRFDEEDLAGLTASIRELGVLQPILVRRAGPDSDASFELIAGERRWRASKRAGLQTIPVVVRDVGTDKVLLEEALVENLHRADLNAMEEAAAYQQLVEDFGLTQEQVATRVGKSRAAISNTLRLFQLPPTIQGLVADGRITAGHARALLGTPDRAYQETLARRIVDEGLSVREAEEAVKGRSGASQGSDSQVAPETPQKATQRSAELPEPAVLELERLLSDHLDTRVSVAMGKGPGKVVIEFADLTDLERVYRKMVGS